MEVCTVSWTLRLGFSTGSKTYDIQRDGFSLNEKVGAKGRHATQIADVCIRSQEANRLLMTEPQKQIPAVILSDGQTVFSGVVRPYLTYSSSGSSEHPLQLQVMDFTEVLHQQAGDSFAWRDLKSSEIVQRILSMAGIDVSVTLPDGFPDAERQWFPIGYDEYLDDVLEEMLWEMGYDFRFTAEGMEILPTSAEDVTASATDIRGSLSIAREDSTEDGVDVSFSAIHEAKDKTLLEFEKEYSDTVPEIGYSVRRNHNGIFYLDSNPSHSEMHDGESVLPDDSGFGAYDVSDLGENVKVLNIDIDRTRSVSLLDKYVTYFGTTTATVGPLSIMEERLAGARFYFTYSGSFLTTNIPYGDKALRGWTMGARIVGDVLYLSQGSTAFRTKSAKNPKSYELKYTYDNEEALAFSQREARRLSTAVFRYAFTSLTPYAVGGFYRVHDVVNGIWSTVRIIERRFDGELLYRYVAEGAGEVEVLPIGAVTGSSQQEPAQQGLAVTASASEVGENSIEFVATGSFLSIPGSSSIWLLNGQMVGTGARATLSPDAFQVGNNEVVCQIILNSEVIAAAGVTVTKDKTDELQIEYAVGTDPDTPPIGDMLWGGEQMIWEGDVMAWDDGLWTTEAPTPGRGQYLWMRTRRA